jgi:hypothetical protein
VIGLAAERGTWMATVNEVLRWWTQRNSVSVDVVDSDSDVFMINLNNQSGEAISGLTLELNLGDVGFNSLEGDLTGDLVAGDLEGTFLLLLDRVPAGTSRVTLNLF